MDDLLEHGAVESLEHLCSYQQSVSALLRVRETPAHEHWLDQLRPHTYRIQNICRHWYTRHAPEW